MLSNSPYKPRNVETSICPSKAITGEIGGNNGARAREKTQSIGCAFFVTTIIKWFYFIIVVILAFVISRCYFKNIKRRNLP